MLGHYGLTWPWESLHVEALAWFDHWLKGRDTGILDDPAIRYWLPGAEEWRTADSWPPAGGTHRELALRADGALADEEGQPGGRDYMVLGAGLNRAKPSEIDPPSTLLLDQRAAGARRWTWSAISNCAWSPRRPRSDTAWIATLQDVAPDGSVSEVTAGGSGPACARSTSRPAGPAPRCCPAANPLAVPIGEDVDVPNPVGAQCPTLRGRPLRPAGTRPATTKVRTRRSS